MELLSLRPCYQSQHLSRSGTEKLGPLVDSSVCNDEGMLSIKNGYTHCTGILYSGEHGCVRTYLESLEDCLFS